MDYHYVIVNEFGNKIAYKFLLSFEAEKFKEQYLLDNQKEQHKNIELIFAGYLSFSDFEIVEVKRVD